MDVWRCARFPLLAAAPAVFTVACSGTAPPAAAPSSEAPASRRGSWLCASSPRRVSLQTLGVPSDSQPIDLALSPEKVTVLLSPARLVTFSRGNPQVVDMIVGSAGDSWRAIDRDPTDGSLWVASEENVSLLRIAENGERGVVVGPRVEGRGGFREIRIARDAIYATPTGATSAVWRLSRDGKLLGQSFPREKEAEAVDAPEGLRRVFCLARDLEGRVVGFDIGAGQLYRAGADGAWTPLPERFPARSPSAARSLRGEAVGTSAETWYFPDEMRGFLFIPGGPVALGSSTAGLRSKGSVLFRVKDGRIERAIEDCAGTSLLIAISDSLGFAAISGSAVQTETSGVRRVLAPQVLLGSFSAEN